MSEMMYKKIGKGRAVNKKKEGAHKALPSASLLVLLLSVVTGTTIISPGSPFCLPSLSLACWPTPFLQLMTRQ